MNTIEELVSNGINEYNAIQMLESYSAKIGTVNGMYEITDIVYDCDSKTRDITLRCTECGKIIHRKMASGKNKWKELIKTCSCEKEREQVEKEAATEQKKAEILERVGRTYGDYTIVSLEDTDTVPKYTMCCKVCGNERVVSVYEFYKIDFRCHKHYEQIKYGDAYIGRKFNRMTVIGFDRTPSGKRAFVCRCDCGAEKLCSPHDITHGVIKSCGCLQKIHGLSGTRIYSIWHGMNNRCYNEDSTSYPYYGGRGISICDEWRNEQGLINFYEWSMANGYSDELTIDRINVNGNYEPSNCRWADWDTQMKNRRPMKKGVEREKRASHPRIYAEIDGVSMAFTDWCKLYDIEPMTVKYRMNKMGMSLKEALTAEKAALGRPKKGA